MTVFFDLVRVYCTTVGSSGPLALGGAVTFSGGAKAFRSFADAGIPDGAVLSWAVEDLSLPGREAGTGIYSASAGTLTRNTTSSTNGNTPLNLSGQAQLYVTALAADLANAGNFSSGTVAVACGGTGASSFTAHGVLLGEGTAAFGVANTGTAGRILLDQGAGSDPAFNAVSGDGTLTASGALVVTRTNGTAFAASATTDTTNAGNISAGTLAAARLPAPTAVTLGGVQSIAAAAHAWVAAIDTSGVPHLSQPEFSDISGVAAASQLPDSGTASDLFFHAMLGGL